jgi:hypothetical protein
VRDSFLQFGNIGFKKIVATNSALMASRALPPHVFDGLICRERRLPLQFKLPFRLVIGARAGEK